MENGDLKAVKGEQKMHKIDHIGIGLPTARAAATSTKTLEYRIDYVDARSISLWISINSGE